MVELVIKISEQEYNECKNRFNMVHQEGYLNYNLNTALVMYIANGTVLPKRHGDLIDRDHIIARLETASKFFGGEHTDAFDERFSQGLKEAAIKVAEEPTVVEADR